MSDETTTPETDALFACLISIMAKYNEGATAEHVRDLLEDARDNVRTLERQRDQARRERDRLRQALEAIVYHAESDGRGGYTMHLYQMEEAKEALASDGEGD